MHIDLVVFVRLNRTFVWRVGLLVHAFGSLIQPEDFFAMVSNFSDISFSNVLTPRGVPFRPLVNVTANKQLLRGADLYSYDVRTPVSWTDVGEIETKVSRTLQEMPVLGKYALSENIVLFLLLHNL